MKDDNSTFYWEYKGFWFKVERVIVRGYKITCMSTDTVYFERSFEWFTRRQVISINSVLLSIDDR